MYMSKWEHPEAFKYPNCQLRLKHWAGLQNFYQISDNLTAGQMKPVVFEWPEKP